MISHIYAHLCSCTGEVSPVATFTSCPTSRQLLYPMIAQSLLMCGSPWRGLSSNKKALSPFVIWSIVKAEALCHMRFGQKTRWGSCIYTQGIAALGTNKKPAMIKANKMMHTYHETADKVGLNGTDHARIVDRADVLMVRLLLDQPVPRDRKIWSRWLAKRCKR